MELRSVDESEAVKKREADLDLDLKESKAEASGSAATNGRKTMIKDASRENGHSILGSVCKVVPQIKKPPHRRSGSPLNWFPRKKIDSYLKRKIRLLQENEGMNLSLDETLGNANPHYTKIAREKIAAREAARKAIEARKTAMIEASWCRILRAARIQSKEAAAELEKAEKCAAEAFEVARAKGVMMYDRPNCPRRLCKVESYSSVSGRATHTVAASFETAFEVDREVMVAIKKAFIQLANCLSSSNKEEFKELLWKISQNPDNNETELDFSETSSESDFDVEFSGDDETNVQGADKKKIKSKYRKLPNGHDKSSAKLFTELVSTMLDRIKVLQEDELASLATIVATSGLNAALLELEHNKDSELNVTGCSLVSGTKQGTRRKSNATQFMDGYSDWKDPLTEVPSLDKFLVKHVSKLEREVEEARKSRCQRTTGASVVTDSDSKLTSSEPIQDLGRILVKHVSKLEKEIQEARKSRKNNSFIDDGKCASLFGSVTHKKEFEGVRSSQGLSENILTDDRELHQAVPSYNCKENLDSNSLMLSTDTAEGHKSGKLAEIANKTQFGAEIDSDQGHMKRPPVKHISRLERAKLEVLHSFSSQEQSSLDKILVKPVHRLEREKKQALEQGNEYGLQRDHKKPGAADLSASESLDMVLTKHVSRLEKERTASGTDYDPISIKKRDQQVEKMESLDQVLVKHQSKLEKAKLVASQQPVYDIIKPIIHEPEAAASESLEKILVSHQPELEKAKLAAAQKPEDYSKHADARKQARERELQEAWGGLSLGNSIRPHLSRLERDRAAWKRAEDDERMQSTEVMK